MSSDSTGGTIEAAARAVRGRGVTGGVTVGATDRLLVPPAPERLSRPVGRLVMTHSLASAHYPELPVEAQSIAAVLADAVGRLHRNEDLAELVVQG